jgi:ABC-type cobalamin/Fe3+-siderophores transport system ATPase subunit
MNSIVILCGGDSCGKTTTLKGFFGVNKEDKSPHFYVQRKLEDKIVCAVKFASPQEKEKFCNVENVNKNIENRITECETKTEGKQYILLIPFTMSGKKKERKKINTDCIIEPIEKLKGKFRVFVIYLRKTNAHNLAEKDALMAKVATKRIETTKNDFDSSAELEKFLREIVVKSY